MQELDVIVEVDNVISQLPVSPEKLQEFRDNTTNDADLQLLQNSHAGMACGKKQST